MIDGIEYIGGGEFVVTEDALKELIERGIAWKVSDWVFGDNTWDGVDLTQDALSELYPGRGSSTYAVADNIVGELMDNK